MTALAVLASRLSELVSVLEQEALPAAEALSAGFARVERALAAARAESAGEAEGWEHCRRLHALARELAARRREDAGAQRLACAALRQRIGAVRERVRSGGACDVAA